MSNAIRAVVALMLFVTAPAFAAPQGTGKPFTIEYYYKIKWGHFDEWLDLYKRNHWPVIASEMKDGWIVGYKMELPQAYLPEPHRWNVRISIAWRGVAVAHNLVEKGREATLARLFPNKAKHDAEEQRRFQLLEGLWEVEPELVKTEDWPGAGRK